MNEKILQAVQAARRASGGDIATMLAAGIKAGLAARDVPGTIHYLVPLKFRMACGRRPEDSYSSVSFWEHVTCAKCLEHKSNYGAPTPQQEWHASHDEKVAICGYCVGELPLGMPHNADDAASTKVPMDCARWMRECPVPHVDLKIRITEDISHAASAASNAARAENRVQAIVHAAFTAAGFRVVE